jgi:hypothetical protein
LKTKNRNFFFYFPLGNNYQKNKINKIKFPASARTTACVHTGQEGGEGGGEGRGGEGRGGREGRRECIRAGASVSAQTQLSVRTNA